MTDAGRRYFAGVDGGATKTLCLVSSEDGKILGFGRTGPSNFHNIGLGAALSNIKLAFDSASDDARVDKKEISVACFGLAGLDSPADERILRKVISPVDFTKLNLVVHDSQMALAAALAGRPGVIVNAGTGSVAGGINSTGDSVRVGGWGNIIGDEGSGYAIGRRALRACMQSFDGRGPPTKLLQLVMKRMDCASPGEIIEAVYVKKMTVAEMAALSSVVTEAADAGDSVAAGILEEAGEELARMAATVAKRLRLDKRRHEVATVGSVFTSDQLLDSFTRNLRTLSPRAVPVSPEFPQVFGSVMLAMRREGIELSSKVLSVLASSMKRLPKSVVANPRAYRAST